MIKDKFKRLFAKAVAQAFREVYREQFKKVGNKKVFNENYIYRHLIIPKNYKMGSFSFPVFEYTKLLNDEPHNISDIIAKVINEKLKKLQ